MADLVQWHSLRTVKQKTEEKRREETKTGGEMPIAQTSHTNLPTPKMLVKELARLI